MRVYGQIDSATGIVSGSGGNIKNREGTGLGGGIIINNQILSGESGYSGQLGHFSINNQGLPCTCGNRGCFKQYASLTALIKRVTAYYRETPDSPPPFALNGKKSSR